MSGVNRLLDLCAEALARPADQRATFLDEACAGEAELRSAVERMLANASSADDFLAGPAWSARQDLRPGTLMGPYEIQSFIGAGGMGAVYKARDTRLGRTVAIKLLPPALAASEERRARFEREARTVAGLNHPNICTLYDVGRHDGSTFLVMEHIDGETLSARLARGPIPLQHALALGAQVADAIATAHRQGVSHRDLKPGNVMLTRRPRSDSGPWDAKLLDFGLAKLASQDPAAGPAETPSTSSAASEPRTGAGRIVGTLPYMAPEQLEGREADTRSDIFAFGAVLYEMVAGRRAFEGDSQASVMSAVLTSEPAPLPSILPVTPPAVDRLIRKCLAKDPEARWQNAADLAVALRWLAGDSAADVERPLITKTRKTFSWWAAGLPVLGLLGLVGVELWRASAPARFAKPAVQRLHLSLPQFTVPPSGPIVSPDGSVLVFRASDAPTKPLRLYAYRFSDGKVEEIDGTEGVEGACFSPDGTQVAFSTAAALHRVNLAGGPPVRVLDAKLVHPRINWTTEGDILFCYRVSPGGVWKVPAEGGQSQAVVPATVTAPDTRYRGPTMLPGGDAVLFTMIEVPRLRERELNVTAFSLSSGKVTKIVRGAEARFFPATGSLVYLADGNLLAVQLDPRSLAVTQQPVALQHGVGLSGTETMGANVYDLSQSGTTLVYTAPPTTVLTWRDRRATRTELAVSVPGTIPFLSLSRDGRRAAVTIRNGAGVRPYLANLDYGEVSLTPLTDGPQDWFGTFSCDGTRLLLSRVTGREEFANIFAIPTDASGEATQQSRGSDHAQKVSSFRCPEDIFLYNDYTADGGDVWEQRLDKPDTARAVVKGAGNQKEAAFSPDGRWIAYTSESSVRGEQHKDVYVQGYPNGPRTLISTAGGDSAVWNPSDGSELFYQSGYAVVSVRVVNGRRQSAPTVVFDGVEGGADRAWDVSPDGRRFLVAERRPVLHMNVVLNWLEELRAKVPPAK